MIEFLKDLWDFMRVRKKFWLAPIIIVLLLLGVLIVLAEGSAVAPFIYTIFWVTAEGCRCTTPSNGQRRTKCIEVVHCDIGLVVGLIVR